jgi:hypothetical protein
VQYCGECSDAPFCCFTNQHLLTDGYSTIINGYSTIINSSSTSREQNNQQGCCYFSHLSHLSTLPNSHLQNGVVRDQSVTSYCNTVTLFRAVHFTRSTLIRKRIQFITDPMYIIIVELSEFSLCRLRCCALFRLASLHVSTQKHHSSVHSESNAPEIATPHGSSIYSSPVTVAEYAIEPLVRARGLRSVLRVRLLFDHVISPYRASDHCVYSLIILDITIHGYDM